ncbi:MULTISPECIES: DUF6607 family protein [unclassified Novosphingobium]|uniref:DUF6607 family protein n=1 Tax=unclassified Novosphingobium TaxID=2644732 RepID=UPI00146E4B73|nr:MULTISPECIES: DUF6607 family protein [unclassified Novosphingobium]NMN03905.1 hypothetical protein [Novosphingobium sp. SG919]NMN86105.1 hypothetical protein [Novosphingobium sp. SG916]
MNRLKTLLGASLLALACTAAPALAHPPIAAEQAAATFEEDRADILAMAGNYKVRFDMQESTRWDPGYTPIDKKTSGGFESVRVIDDTGRRIVLQHLLVVNADGKEMVVKHWRQDWEYEPARVLVYADTNTWKWEDVPEKMRTGRWSQTVYQVDDSPRYGGWGQFETQGGVRRWRSNWTWRPLARRDAVRHPVYDRYLAINRHQITPDGWIHWQDNTKLGPKNGKLAPIVQEYVLNTYTKFDGYNVKAADDYWAATKDYWAAVRAEWDRVAKEKGGIGVQEEAETGTVISARLMALADDIRTGKTNTAKATVAARKLIAENTRTL